jgi:hypothetical protein
MPEAAAAEEGFGDWDEEEGIGVEGVVIEESASPAALDVVLSGVPQLATYAEAEPSASDLAAEARRIAPTAAPRLFMLAVCASGPSKVTQHAEALKLLLPPNGGRLLLSALEELLSGDGAAKVAFSAVYLKNLYEADLIQESDVFEWVELSGGEEVKEKAAPFITWLEEAEEEDSDEDSEEDQ